MSYQIKTGDHFNPRDFLEAGTDRARPTEQIFSSVLFRITPNENIKSQSHFPPSHGHF